MNQYRKLRSIVITTLFISIGLCVIHIPLQAQNTAYRIGPRDVLTLTIFAGGEKQNVSSMTVSSQGMINVPFIGPVMAKGLTVTQLEDSVTKPLAADYFVNPEVNIVISEYHSLHYYISGAVGSPGLYEMKSSATLLELIAKAGGASPDHGSIAYILHPSSEQTASKKSNKNPKSDNEPLKIDLNKLLDKGDMSQNVELQSGDVIYIPLVSSQNLSASKIYVEGEVKSPGVYTYQEGLTALNACIMAGGFSKFAAPNRTRIIRQNGNKQIIIKINLNDVRDGKIPDAVVKPGDRIHIPETWL
ncbi:MAG: polysaccharide biosynthesis/export family protein [Desulfobacterales bacterium]|jgi:polysaccharide export outer membrane protein